MTSEKPGPFDRILRHADEPEAEYDRAVVYVAGAIIGLAILLLVLVLPPVSILSRGGDSRGPTDTPAVAAKHGARRGSFPDLPDGLVAVSVFQNLSAPEDGRGPAAVTVELKDKQSDVRGLAMYTFTGGEWLRLSDVTLTAGGAAARAEVATLPGNVAVLKRSGSAMEVAATIPAGATLDERAGASLTTLHPLVFIPGDDGFIAGQPPAVPPAAYRVVPGLVAPDPAVVDGILRSSDLRAKHAAAISEAVRQGNYAGINVDYHTVNSSLKDEFTDFVTQLAASLEADGRTLTLTLPPPQGRGEDIDEGAYDWKQLGARADTIELLGEMDQELYFQRTEDALDYVTSRVDRNKVLLTIPSNSVERGSDGLRTLPLLDALAIAGAVTAQADGAVTPSAQVRLISSNLASSEGASGIHWDETARAVTFKYPGLGGQRTVWIGNEFSAAFRIALAQKFGLGGVVISDASVEGGGGNVWPAVQRALDEQRTALSTPNGEILIPTWTAGAGALSGASGEEVTWTAPAEDGAYEVMLIVSDGVIRAAQRIALEVATPQ